MPFSKSFLLITLFYTSGISYSRMDITQKEVLIKRSGFFIGAATSLFWIEANLNYEIIFLQRSRNNYLGFGLQTGVGFYGAVFEDSGSAFNPKLVILCGKTNNFFEFAAGANLFTDIDTYYWSSEFVPSGCIGFRSHGKNGKSLLRLGVGWPMGLYVGLGGRF